MSTSRASRDQVNRTARELLVSNAVPTVPVFSDLEVERSISTTYPKNKNPKHPKEARRVRLFADAGPVTAAAATNVADMMTASSGHAKRDQTEAGQRDANGMGKFFEEPSETGQSHKHETNSEEAIPVEDSISRKFRDECVKHATRVNRRSAYRWSFGNRSLKRLTSVFPVRELPLISRLRQDKVSNASPDFGSTTVK